jgi:broad specificity phosphatase PhoE
METCQMVKDDATGTRLLLARHAETAAPDRFHGAESDIGLSAWGFEQAERLGRWLTEATPTALYSSAMRRAVDTAAPIGRACGLEPVAIPELHERRIGTLSGVSREEGWATYNETKSRWIAGELEVSHPGGESFADIRRRVCPILEELAGRHRGQTVVVIAHGVVIRVALISLVTGFTPADFDKIAIDFASVNNLWHDGRTWTARALNQVVAPSPARPVA